MKGILSTALFGVFTFAAFLSPNEAQAQIQEVKQTVFGMDCAPCAHGLQKRLSRIEGVTDVTVSLNEGLAVLRLEPANDAKLETIREAVTESGFAAKEATIRVSGALTQENGKVVLVSETGDRYDLKQSERGAAEYERLKGVTGGRHVIVTGIIPEGEKKERWILQVLEARV